MKTNGTNRLKFVFFGSSKFSEHVLEKLEKAGFVPAVKVTDARMPLPEIKDVDTFIVASFGKILPKDFIAIPKYGSLNVHPSLLPKLRGPSPIQETILRNEEAGVTIIKMDEKMDHGPILAQEKVIIEPWPDHYTVVEEKLGRAGGNLLAKILLDINSWKEILQDNSQATYTKLIKKEGGLLDLNDPPEINLRKTLAYSTWPCAYFFFKTKTGKNLRIVVKDAKVEDGKFVPVRVIPEGKHEMDWKSFLRGNA